MNDEKPPLAITLSADEDEYVAKTMNVVENNIERIEDEIRKVFPLENYERLVNYAAKLFIESSIMKNERREFADAMLAIEFAKADGNKEVLEQIKERFKENSLFKRVLHVNFYEGKFKSWNMNKAAHENDRKAKKLVLEWWKDDGQNHYLNKDGVIEIYQSKLNQLGLYPKCNTKSKIQNRKKGRR